MNFRKHKFKNRNVSIFQKLASCQNRMSLEESANVHLRTVLLIGSDGIELQTSLEREIENVKASKKNNEIKIWSIVNLLLEAQDGKTPELPQFDVYRSEDDNKYDDLDLFDLDLVQRKESFTIIVLYHLEYLLMEFVSKVAKQVVFKWLENLVELTSEANCSIIASICCDKQTQINQKKLERLFSRIITVQTDPTSTEAVRALASNAGSQLTFDEFWKGIVGFDQVKHALERLVRWRWYRQPHLKRMGVSCGSGIMLVGPSGCGKTMFASRLGEEKGLTFITIKASEVFSKWYGESEKALREAFAKARANRPCILFLDEVQTLAPERSQQSDEALAGGVNVRVLSTLLNELDGVDTDNSGLVVIGATSDLNSVDRALVRPGRLGAIVEVPHPTENDRLALLKHFFKDTHMDPDVDWQEVSRLTLGYSVAKLEAMATAAAYAALWEGSDRVAKRHLEQAMDPFASLL